MKSKAEIMRNLRNKRREEGRVKLELWPLDKNKQAIKDFADKLDRG